ncbi:hypothetical protein LCFBJUUZ_CDS0153 [Staphylococcus phage PG-2021_76]|uniref:Uncharacterized protein n=1 Tax=Mammaliicoccus phage MSShimriz1 TaxID=3230127 RepID=A0AAU8GRQ5_9VIRU
MTNNERYELLKQTRFSLLGNLGAFLILVTGKPVQLHNESDYMALKNTDGVLVEIKDLLVHDHTWQIEKEPALNDGIAKIVQAIQVTCSEMNNLVDKMNSEYITEAVNDMFNE